VAPIVKSVYVDSSKPMARTLLRCRSQIVFAILCLLLFMGTPAQNLIEESVSTAGIEAPLSVDAEPVHWSDIMVVGAALATPMRGQICSDAATNSQLVEHTILRL
jgi:hypothetical protein